MSSPSTSFALEARGSPPAPDSSIGRAHIGVQPEILAQPQQPGLRPHVVRHLVPFRPADRAEDHRVGGLRLGHGLVGDRDAMRVVGAAADTAPPRSSNVPMPCAFIQAMSFFTSAMTSGPMPSPGRRRRLWVAWR